MLISGQCMRGKYYERANIAHTFQKKMSKASFISIGIFIQNNVIFIGFCFDKMRKSVCFIEKFC